MVFKKRKTPRTVFKKGHKKVGGRKKGTPNHITTDLKQAIINALDRLGGEEWFIRLGKRDAKSFANLIGRCIPTKLVGPDDGAIKVLHMTDKLSTMSDTELQQLRKLIVKLGLGED